MNIAVVGTGYVGLVTGTCFAESGNNVVCVDIDPEKLQKLNSGIIPIYEPGLEAMFLRNIKEKRLTFTNNLAEAANNSEIIFLALPTPPMEDGSADLKYVLNVAKDLAKIIKDYKVVVNKSTVPVGTADKVKAIFTENTQVLVDVCSNPEFLREGSAVEDFMKPERVVVGTDSTRVVELMSRLYKPFVMSGNSVIFMDIRSAELTKYAANSFLATKITFMNEIANLCERVGADVDNVRIGIGSDSRIGKRFLFPGIGYGGSCFPKDVQALHHTATEYQYDFQILTAVMAINNHQKEILIDKVISFFGEDLTGLSFAVWGLAFKPNTDDIREAPALVIIQELLARGAAITAFDPEAINEVKKHYPQLNITFAANRDETLKNQDALLIVTEWNEFRTPDFGKMKTLLKQPVVFDGRNILNVNEMQSLGFYYNSIGRQTVDGRKKA